MITEERSLLSILNVDAKKFALYTAENRALPNVIDGFKPVQRFFICRALQLNRSNFTKLASIGGAVADLGYHHGENSAVEAGALMANTWNNNFPLLEGQGNFGSRLVQEAAASRYIFCRISEGFHKVYKDHNVCPVHEDKEHIPPAFYLPIIPTVLLNGVKGIATGYATNILPHNFKSVVESTKAVLQGREVHPEVEFPKFSGRIEKTDKGVEIFGTYKFTSKSTMVITEVPIKWDRASYIADVLDPLEDKGLITYDDECSRTGFGFKVKFRKEFNLDQNDDARIIREFKLSQKIGQFIVVIDEKGKLRDDFETPLDVVKHFVSVRKPYIQKRIDTKIKETKDQFDLALERVLFIKAVLKEEIVLKGKTRAQLVTQLEERNFKNIDKLVSMSIYSMTNDELTKLAEKARELKKEHDYWLTTSVETEYLKDLDSI
ncbi:DNA topoisomerase II [Pseudomonas phage PspYZU05]|uniref:DNA topoisomerase (ATP-hydrolyzing) n=1 Tax=Pseudomonas phage PspYZU05 TaxID=1983556 RepID=A0A2U7N8A6_9CAUD|nr:DNA topoisomerase II [Pseudomonas phage PspYZU05]ASD52043.1 DNA topisomerase II medium subunit [Pseudomonas phage PspYZU05]